MSASNCYAAYEQTFLMSSSEKGPSNSDGWQFGMKLTTDHVWDAFVISSLLRQHEKKHKIIVVPHHGNQRDRFTALMEERNREIIEHGQEEISHYCDKCMRVWIDEENNLRMY